MVSGFGGLTHLDLADIAAGGTVSYAANADGSGGVLTVTRREHSANLALTGHYDPNGFHVGADPLGRALVDYWIV